MFCPSCGAKNLGTARTCAECGRALPHVPRPGGTLVDGAAALEVPATVPDAPAPAPASPPRILKKPAPLAPPSMDVVPRNVSADDPTLIRRAPTGPAPVASPPPIQTNVEMPAPTKAMRPPPVALAPSVPRGISSPDLANAPRGISSPDLANAPRASASPSSDLANAPRGISSPSSDLANAPRGISSPDLANAPRGISSPDLGNAPRAIASPSADRAPSPEPGEPMPLPTIPSRPAMRPPARADEGDDVTRPEPAAMRRPTAPHSSVAPITGEITAPNGSSPGGPASSAAASSRSPSASASSPSSPSSSSSPSSGSSASSSSAASSASSVSSPSAFASSPSASASPAFASSPSASASASPAFAPAPLPSASSRASATGASSSPASSSALASAVAAQSASPRASAPGSPGTPASASAAASAEPLRAARPTPASDNDAGALVAAVDAAPPTVLEVTHGLRWIGSLAVDVVAGGACAAGAGAAGLAAKGVRLAIQPIVDFIHANPAPAIALLVGAPLLGVFLYEALSVLALGGTLGQRALGLRVVRLRSGAKPGPMRAVVRAAFLIAGALPFLAGPLYGLLLDRRRRGFGDIVARTVVARPPPADERRRA